MKIGVVSDTHSRPLPRQLIEEFAKVDLIIHAGDFCDLADVKQWVGLKPFKAVHGNMDVAAVTRQFPRRQIIEAEEVKIGLFHGEGARQGLRERVANEFKGDPVNVVIFGHSHEACNESVDGVLYFNPGSPNDDVFAPYCSYGILEVSGGTVKGKIIKVKKANG